MQFGMIVRKDVKYFKAHPCCPVWSAWSTCIYHCFYSRVTSDVLSELPSIVRFNHLFKIYFASESWSVSQEYLNNTITQKWLVIAQYRTSVMW